MSRNSGVRPEVMSHASMMYENTNSRGRGNGNDPDWGPALGRVSQLSEREIEVFQLLGCGLSNRAIASRIRVTERTVKAHVARIMEKLELESRLQVGLVSLSYRGFSGRSAAC